MERPRNLATGIPELDAPRGGVPVGGLTIIGGRPESGKFTLLWEIAARLAAAGHRVAVCSMGADNHDGPTRFVHACESIGLDAPDVGRDVVLLTPCVPTMREFEALLADEFDVVFIESTTMIEPHPLGGSIGVDLAELAAHRGIVLVAGCELVRAADGRPPRPADLRSVPAFCAEMVVLLHRVSPGDTHTHVEVDVVVDAAAEHPHEGTLLMSGIEGRFLL